MKIRQAKKILNMMARGTDTRYFDSKYTEVSQVNKYQLACL